MPECFHPPDAHLRTLRAWRTVTPGLRRLAGAIGPAQWTAPTPCSRWDVRALANHLAAELLSVPAYLNNEGTERTRRRFGGDVLGANPVGVLVLAADNALRAFERPGALDRRIRLPYGPRDGLGYARELAADLTVHWWDLDRALGSPHGPLPASAVEFALDEFIGYRDLAATGLFAPPLPAPACYAPLAELLARSGRDPAWPHTA